MKKKKQCKPYDMKKLATAIDKFNAIMAETVWYSNRVTLHGSVLPRDVCRD